MASLKRRQRQGLLKLYKYRSVEDIDAHLTELRAGVHTIEYASMQHKNDVDVLLDARLGLTREEKPDG